MPRAGSLTTFSANTVAQAAQVNTNFSTLRDAVNDYGMWTDYATTVTVTHTYTLTQTFTGGWTAGAACTVSTGGLTVTAGGVTVSAGGITVTGNSTITGTLGGVTTLTCTTVTATNLGGTLTTAAQPNITSVGTLTSLTMGGAITGVTSLSATGNLSANGQVYSAGVTSQAVVGATVTVNWNNGNFQGLAWNSNGTTIAFSNPQEGAVYYLRLVVGPSTGYNLTWPAAVDWTGTPLTSAPVDATTYLIRLLYDGTTYWADYTANLT